jgi:uncharacterized protein
LSKQQLLGPDRGPVKTEPLVPARNRWNCDKKGQEWSSADVTDPASIWLLVALLAAVGAMAGVIAGLLGVGGGIILVPAFHFVFSALGYGGPHLMQVCLATSLATIIVTSIRSVRAHDRKGAVDWAILRGWAPGAAAGAALAGLAATGMRSDVLMLVFGTLGLLVAAYLAFGRADWRLGSELPEGWPRLLTSLSIGFLSVLMGIGGGSFGVPLMSLYGRPIHRAVATASGFGVAIAVPSVAWFLLARTDETGLPPWSLGYVNLPAFAIVAAMTLLSAPLGVRLAHATDPAPLRRLFALFIGVMALNMLRKGMIG